MDNLRTAVDFLQSHAPAAGKERHDGAKAHCRSVGSVGQTPPTRPIVPQKNPARKTIPAAKIARATQFLPIPARSSLSPDPLNGKAITCVEQTLDKLKLTWQLMPSPGPIFFREANVYHDTTRRFSQLREKNPRYVKSILTTAALSPLLSGQYIRRRGATPLQHHAEFILRGKRLICRFT
jgi:hypothetical protein